MSAVLWKFGHIIGPSPDILVEEQKEQELDSWFELMKRLQQYPDKEPDWEGLPGHHLSIGLYPQTLGCFLQTGIEHHHKQEQFSLLMRQKLAQ